MERKFYKNFIYFKFRKENSEKEIEYIKNITLFKIIVFIILQRVEMVALQRKAILRKKI